MIFLIFNNKWATKIVTGLSNPNPGVSPGYNHCELLYSRWVKIIDECILIPKREYIIVFGEDLKLDIYLRNYCNWLYNSQIIRTLSHDFFPSRKKRVFHINLCIIVCLTTWHGDNISWWLTKINVKFLNSHKTRLWF